MQNVAEMAVFRRANDGVAQAARDVQEASTLMLLQAANRCRRHLVHKKTSLQMHACILYMALALSRCNEAAATVLCTDALMPARPPPMMRAGQRPAGPRHASRGRTGAQHVSGIGGLPVCTAAGACNTACYVAS